MKYKRSELSECELATMKCVWDMEEPVTASEIMHRLKDVYGMNYKDTTVYTFLKKLMDKGFVTCYRRGVMFYQPARKANEFRREYMRKACDFWYEGSASKMVAGLLSDLKVSEADKEEIRKLLK
jgi:predicted transcriptional regulator